MAAHEEDDEDGGDLRSPVDADRLNIAPSITNPRRGGGPLPPPPPALPPIPAPNPREEEDRPCSSCERARRAAYFVPLAGPDFFFTLRVQSLFRLGEARGRDGVDQCMMVVDHDRSVNPVL